MKNAAVVFLLSILLLSCSKGVEKPDNLLSEGKMEDILYDVALLQVMSSFTPKTLDDNEVNAGKYIYKKYAIDSLTFAQNQVYYASNLEAYKKIQGKVAERLKKQKTLVDTLVKKEQAKTKDIKKPELKMTKPNALKDSAKALIRRAPRSR
jgi:hypothetical protein